MLQVIKATPDANNSIDSSADKSVQNKILEYIKRNYIDIKPDEKFWEANEDTRDYQEFTVNG